MPTIFCRYLRCPGTTPSHEVRAHRWCFRCVHPIFFSSRFLATRKVYQNDWSVEGVRSSLHLKVVSSGWCKVSRTNLEFGRGVMRDEARRRYGDKVVDGPQVNGLVVLSNSTWLNKVYFEPELVRGLRLYRVIRILLRTRHLVVERWAGSSNADVQMLWAYRWSL